MDELEISGKRYISSRRAGKEHRYHPDYIGQLIRGGKVPGQKVGRAWYVDAEALKAYFSGEFVAVPENENVVPIVTSTEEIAPEILNTASKEEEPSPVEIVPEQPTHIPVTVTSLEDIASRSTYTMGSVHLSVKDAEEKPEILLNTKGLQYVADDSDLFPSVSKTKTALVVSAAPTHVEKEVRTQTAAPIPYVRLAMMGLAVFVVVAVASSELTSVLQVGQNQEAFTSISVGN